ncbi:hypothetical protein hrd7_18930 [Leptolinea sp. HRD-7]|nr:hypothetical protein hrd7_18930 [Leptolinea sp. HRD-7]
MLEEVVFRIRYKRIRLFEAIKAFQFPIILGISTRVGYSLWMALIWYMVDGYFPLTEKALHETYYQLSRSTTLLGRSFIDVWLRWDAVHYMNIAELGYQGVGKEETVFFPLYPYTVGFLSHITSINVTLVGILVSSFFTILALICLYDLVLLQFKDENLSKLSTLLFALYPTSFFLHAPFTDAMFMFFTISSILMMEKREYMAAGILGCLAGLTRAQGALLLIPMFVYFIQDYWIDKNLFSGAGLLQWRSFPLGLVLISFGEFIAALQILLQVTNTFPV